MPGETFAVEFRYVDYRFAGGEPMGGFWSFVNAPWLSAVFIAMLLGNAVLSMALQIVSMKKTYASISETANFSNAVFGYISNKLSKYQIGKDLKVNRLRVCVDNMLMSFHDTFDKVIKKWVAIDMRYSTYSSVASNAFSAIVYIAGDRTAIFISHRLSSCRFCNDIAVFHEGRLIQRGGHETLVSDADGKYYELWNAQAQYYVNA